ncbi:MAG: MerR family transcriptional regulator [Agathobacter sp.]|nr:MerR family transcriptional regulator [Agathobacter sp.]MDY3795103.1 MerR family transcriptional regulator [Agathobacter sp.]
MEKLRYMISDAAAAVNVETHVLRYWEEELELSVPRNEMGHRYYTKENINEFLKIKELKEQGYQLKEIKNILHGGELPKEVTPRAEITSEVRMEQFKEIMNDIVGHAISLNNEELSQQIGTEVQERVLKEMNYLMREQEEASEERYKKLDSAIRGKMRKGGILPKILKKPIHA